MDNKYLNYLKSLYWEIYKEQILKTKDQKISFEEGLPKNPLKKLILKIPILNRIAWHLYMILVSPGKILALFEEQKRFEKEFLHRFEEINKLITNLEEKNRLFEKEFLHRFEEIEEFKVFDLSIFFESYKKLANFFDISVNNEKDFYYYFEKTFRGNIKEKLKKYIPYLREIFQKQFNLLDKSYFLDVGCGAGEFLELLEEEGLPYLGIDINDKFIDEAKAKNLNIIKEEVISYLSKIEDNFLLGITAFHLIEHLSFEEAKYFIKLSFQKIKPGGILIIETPNPKCPIALANFYLDFTHQKPYPHELLAFLCLFYGFRGLKLVLSTPADRTLRTGNLLSDYMDFAIIAYKPEKEL